MARLTAEERTDIIRIYSTDQRSQVETIRAFKQLHRRSVNASTIKYIIKTFEEQRSVGNRNRTRSGRPKMSSEDNVAAIDAVIAKDPEKSVRRTAAEPNLPETSVHRVIRDCHCIRIECILQQQREANKLSRLEICDTFCVSSMAMKLYCPASNSVMRWILSLGLSGGQSVPRLQPRNTGATQAELCSGSSEQNGQILIDFFVFNWNKNVWILAISRRN